MQAKMFNPQIFLECLCCSVFGGLMLYLVRSGAYLSYVTPRLEPYLYFTAAVMLIWTLTGLFRLFRPQHKVRSAHCLVLAIPILLLLLPHSPLGASDLSGGYVGGNAFSGRSGQGSYGASENPAPPSGAGAEAAAGIPDKGSASGSSGLAESDPPPGATASAGTSSPAAPEGEASDALPGLDTANRKITVADDDFGMWLSEIYADMGKYEGYTVVMSGFVFKNPDMLKEDEFVPARLMMSCCVADLAPAGFLCKYDKAPALAEDSWVTVEGTLFIGRYEYGGRTYDDPQIRVTKVSPAKEVQGYVYPYY